MSDTLSAVLRDEPEWPTLPPLPPSLERLLRHCLLEDPRSRLRDIGDSLPSLQDSDRIETTERKPRRAKWMAAALGAALVAAVVLYANLIRVNEPAAVGRWVITLPVEQTLVGRYTDAITLSPEGNRLVYVAEVGGVRRLFLRELDAFEAEPVSGTEGALAPFFSPDGESIGFFVGDEIRRVSLSGGVATLICRMPVRSIEPHAVWGLDGQIVLNVDRFVGLYRVNAAGGKPEHLTVPRLDEGERSHRRPYLLPNGDVLFAI